MKKNNLSALFLIFGLFMSYQTISAQTSFFTYQGKLTDAGAAASGQYDFRFRLFNDDNGGTPIAPDVSAEDVQVTNGIFKVDLDFGAAVFTSGGTRFLEISVRPGASTGALTTLAPRQQITSAPFAIKTLSANSADALSANCNLCVTDAQIDSIAGNKLTGVISGNGAGLTNINGGNIAAGTVTSSQLSQEAVPNSAAYKLLGSLRWDLLKPQATFPVGNTPQAVAFDGANIWVANSNSANVTKLRASDGAHLGTFPVASGPVGVAFDGANVWVTNSGNGNVMKLRASDGANLGTFPVGIAPQGVAFDGANVWVANLGDNNVTKLRASDGANLGTFPVGSGPSGLAFDGANVWVANVNGSNVTKLRANDGAQLGTFPVPSPRGVAFDGANIWVTNGGSTVTKLRASDGANLGTFPVGNSPLGGIAFDGANIWVTAFNSNNVTKLRASDGANLGTFPVASGPVGVAFDGANIWVANSNSNTVTRLQPAFPQP